jgi:ring-1,2-phenylacetyl-CoA epoxidase subunit PaaD
VIEHNIEIAGKENMSQQIMKALQKVKDPEIDSVSIIELGMLKSYEFTDSSITIHLLPTFSGCPALEIIRKNVTNAIQEIKGITNIDVQFHHHPPWTSDRVTEAGRIKLKEFGIAPPPRLLSENGEWQVDCPFCESTYTTLDNLFGPTACRSILYCKSCKNPFEAMKPMSIKM